MTEEHKKEYLSTRFIQAFAHYLGYGAESAELDYGMDVRIIEYTSRVESGKKRYSISGRELRIQVKATTISNIRKINGNINYDLKVNNYNDIVKLLNSHIPMYLFLFVLPDDEIEWANLTNDELILKGQCYWYIHPSGTVISRNKKTCAIQIPELQIINQTTISNLLDSIYI